MSDKVEFSLIGLDSLLNTLASLKNETKYKSGRFALRKAAQLIANAAKHNADRLDDPKTGRKISDNIAVRWNGKLYRSTGNLGFRVGVLGGSRLPKGGNPDTGAGGRTPHWHLLEFGTEHSRAKPFMRPAAEQNISAAIDEFVKQYSKSIDRAIKRAIKVG